MTNANRHYSTLAIQKLHDLVLGGETTGINLTNLDDVIITTPVSNHVLRYNGTNWVNTQDLTLIGAFDISNTAPSITLTDTTVSAKSLKIDVDANIAQIRELSGANKSLLFFDLANNTIGMGNGAAGFGSGLVNINKIAPPGNNLMYMELNTGGSLGTFNIIRLVNYPNASINTMIALNIIQSGYNIQPGTALYGIQIGVPDPATDTAIGVRVTRQTASTKNYGFYYGTATMGSEPAGNYAVYADSDNSYFGAKVGVGIIPTATVHIKAGTATANTAPLKLTAGTNLTTEELGAVEFTDNGTAGNLYMTTNVAAVATRREVLLGTGWTSYTPVVTSETGGWTNYTATGYYRVVDKILTVSFKVVFSAASGVVNGMLISLPTGRTMNASVMAGGAGWDTTHVGRAVLGDNGTVSGVPAMITTRTSTTVLVQYYNAAAASYLTGAGLTNTAPWTWTTSDEVVGEFTVPIT